MAVLVSLIGRSPVPIIAGLSDLGGGIERHFLVCSRSTQPAALAVGNEGTMRWQIQLVQDEHNPHSTAEAFAEIRGQLGAATSLVLNYTGGTKAMLAGSILSLEHGDKAWYLNEKTRTWIGLDGEHRPSDYRVTLESLARFHGYRVVHQPRVIQANLEDLRQVLAERIMSGEGLGMFYGSADMGRAMRDYRGYLKDCEIRRSRVRKAPPFAAADVPEFLEELLEDCRRELKATDLTTLEHAVLEGKGAPGRIFDLAGNGWQDQVQGASFFLDSLWLEGLVAQVLKPFCEKQGLVVHGSTIMIPSSAEGPVQAHFRQREADVVVVRPQGVLLVSVTTSSSQKVIRQKAEEAVMLAGLLGGPNGQAVVVSAGGIYAIRNIGNLGKPPHVLRILGVEDLKLLSLGEDQAFVERILNSRAGSG